MRPANKEQDRQQLQRGHAPSVNQVLSRIAKKNDGQNVVGPPLLACEPKPHYEEDRRVLVQRRRGPSVAPDRVRSPETVDQDHNEQNGKSNDKRAVARPLPEIAIPQAEAAYLVRKEKQQHAHEQQKRIDPRPEQRRAGVAGEHGSTQRIQVVRIAYAVVRIRDDHENVEEHPVSSDQEHEIEGKREDAVQCDVGWQDPDVHEQRHDHSRNRNEHIR